MVAVFVTGTDTGCGKTHISEALLRGAKSLGLKVAGMKPIATGVDYKTNENEDIRRLADASSPSPPARLLNQYCFPDPCSPNIAANASGSEISLKEIDCAFQRLNATYEFVVVEAVGGWKVPLGQNITVADMAITLNIPVILVVGIKLGCINHAILTSESLQNSKVQILGWVANLHDDAILFPNDVLDTLSSYLKFPLLEVVRKNASSDGLSQLASSVLENIGKEIDSR